MNLEQPGQILNRFHVDLHPDIASKGWQYSEYIHVCAERAHSEDKLADLFWRFMLSNSYSILQVPA